MRADRSQNASVSTPANAMGNHEAVPGDSKEELTTVAPSCHTGMTYPHCGPRNWPARAGRPRTIAVAPAAKKGLRNVENIRATVPASAQAPSKQTMRNQTWEMGNPAAPTVQLPVMPRAKQ